MEGNPVKAPVIRKRKHGLGKPLFVAYCKDCNTHWDSWAESNYVAVLWHKQRRKNCSNPAGGFSINNSKDNHHCYDRNKESSSFNNINEYDSNQHEDEDCVVLYSDQESNVNKASYLLKHGDLPRAEYFDEDDELEGNMNAPDSSDMLDENEMDEVRIDADSLIDIDMVNKCKFKYKPMTIGERDALCQKFFNIKNQKPSFIIFELQR